MLTIRAVSFKGRPIDREISGRFGEAGGTIGRGDASTLVLPDPERYISRTHAAISFQAGGFVITDSGSKNPILINGRPLGPGSQTRLTNADEITIGDYTLQVVLAPVPAAPAPGGQVPRPESAATRIADPFADLLKPGPSKAQQQKDMEAARPWPEPAAAPAPRPQPGTADDPLVRLRGPDPSLDELFDLRKRPPSDLAAPDALPESLSPSGAAPRSADPFELLGAPPRPVAPRTAPDHVAEIFAPYVPPAARPESVVDAKIETLPTAAQSVVMPQPGAPPAAVVANPAAAPTSSAQPTPTRDSQTPPIADEALLEAFLRGSGLTSKRIPALTPETMEVVGILLREAVQGTLDLLRARGLTKSELRADVTMVMAADNNPLKFSPTVESALNHLLAAPLPGFMTPVRAMKDAYDDLRAHQIGFLAGMRAALDEVLARFAPQELERRLADPSMLDTLLPMNRKGKLWDLFVERYGSVAEEAREDFNATFGKAFLRAYEAQVKRLRSERSAKS